MIYPKEHLKKDRYSGIFLQISVLFANFLYNLEVNYLNKNEQLTFFYWGFIHQNLP